MRGFLLIGAAMLALLPALPAAAQSNQTDPDWCRQDGWPAKGFCTKQGRWKVRLDRATVRVYFQDGRVIALPIAYAEANGSLSSDRSAPRPRSEDQKIDDALDAAGVPH